MAEGEPSMTHSIRPQKMALIVAQRIVRDIERQGLGPGDKLPPERMMMENYEAGRGTLRESLRFLELQGVLSFKPGPGGGPVIEKPSAENLATTLTLLLQFDDARYRVIAEAREAFEPVMAQLAARRITPEHPGTSSRPSPTWPRASTTSRPTWTPTVGSTTSSPGPPATRCSATSWTSWGAPWTSAAPPRASSTPSGGARPSSERTRRSSRPS